MRYRVDIKDSRIIDCYKIRKNHNPIDYALVRQYKSYAHIDYTTMQIKAYLLYANTSDDAKIKVVRMMKS